LPKDCGLPRERIEAIIWSPSGQLLASAGRDGVVRVWKFISIKIGVLTPVHPWNVGKGYVQCVDWFNDEERLLVATGSTKGYLHVYDFRKQEVQWEEQVKSSIRTCSTLPDQRHCIRRSQWIA
jgi:WD40 repeat protein